MKVIKPGHLYELEATNKSNEPQLIRFVEKMTAKDAGMDLTIYKPDEFITVNDGTTNEEVLLMLIDRLQTLDKKLPSLETEAAIRCCEGALAYLQIRTAKRTEQGVESTPLPHN